MADYKIAKFNAIPRQWGIEDSYYILLALTIGALPIAIRMLYLFYFFGGSIVGHMPFDGDSAVYWTQINSMKHVGLNFGYYGYEQTTAKFLSFGFHGLWYPAVMYALSLFQAWKYYSIPFIQTGALSLGLFLYVWQIRPTWQKSTAIALFLCTFYPVLFSTTQSIQDCLHYAFAVVLALLYYKYVFGLDNTKGYLERKVVLIAFIFGISLCRISWIISIFPIIMFDAITLKGGARKYAGIVGLLIGVAVVYYCSYKLFNAPYPYDNDNALVSFTAFLTLKDISWLNRVTDNVANLFEGPATSDHLSSFAFRYQCLVIFLFCQALLIINKDSSKSNRVFFMSMAILLMMSIGVVTMMSLVHTTYFIIMFRHLSSAVIFVFLFTVPRIHTRQLFVMLLLAALALPFQMSMYNCMVDFSMDSFGYKHAKTQSARQQLDSCVIYDSDSKSKWCNTMVTLNYDIALSLPPGIGLNTVKDIHHVDSIRAKYVFLPQGLFQADISRLGLVLAGQTVIGDVYFNPKSSCQP